MKTLKILSALFLLSFATPAFAANQLITVGVNGMVCDFCAQALEKVFSDKEEVEDIQVSLNDKVVLITLKDGQNIDDATLTQLINASGYDIRNITRSDVVIENKEKVEDNGSAL